jgi:hypothetical protein
VAFSNHEAAMIHVHWDRFHRIVRDVKLAFAHACGGVFQKAHLYTSYLWSVNRKPYGTGAFGTQKKWLLELFLATNDRHGEAFSKYGHKIASDFCMPFRTEEDMEAVWQEVARMTSFNQAGGETKLGRWFSWNASASKQLREFYASKMLLEALLDHSVPDPDEDAVAFDNLEAAAQALTPREELAKLRATVGGLRLAYKLMSAKLHMTARVMYVATMACWTWYSREVEQVKSAREGVSRTLAASQGKWAKDWHLGLGIRQTMYNFTNLAFRGATGVVRMPSCRLSAHAS